MTETKDDNPLLKWGQVYTMSAYDIHNDDSDMYTKANFSNSKMIIGNVEITIPNGGYVEIPLTKKPLLITKPIPLQFEPSDFTIEFDEGGGDDPITVRKKCSCECKCEEKAKITKHYVRNIRIDGE